MGSPVSVVVVEIVMQHVEERALETCRQTIPLWLSYVDVTFTAVNSQRRNRRFSRPRKRTERRHPVY